MFSLLYILKKIIFFYDFYVKLLLIFNNINNVKKYIDSGNDLDIMNDRGNTPLTYACYHGMPKIVELLLNSGVDVNKKIKMVIPL